MSASQRLPAPYGRLIDRARPIAFRFDGRDYTGYAGDTIASALIGAGQSVLARSFKYRRPRGALSLNGFDANLLVQVGDAPNVSADTVPLRHGMPAITSQNRSGSAAKDRGAWTGMLKRFLPVGFYYRSFFGSGKGWQRYEGLFRARAGLGRISLTAEHQLTDKRQLFCDLAVVGGGVPGLAAAITAARAGASVCLVDAAPRLGGGALYGPDAGLAAIQPMLREVAAHRSITVLTGAIAQGLYEGHLLAVETADCYYKIRAGSVVLATGGHEQPLIFRNNDLPGVMLASAARRLLWLYGVRPGTRAVVLTVNDHGLHTALQLADAGVEIEAVADLRKTANPLHEALADRGATILMSSGAYQAFGPGHYFGGPVDTVQLARLEDDGSASPLSPSIRCDLVVMAGGYAPAAGLACHRGARLVYDTAVDGFRVENMPHGILMAGPPREILNHPYPIIPHPSGGEFVDFDEDLTIADIKNAIADGFAHGELLKRYSTAGMGPSQGRQSALAVLRIAARENGMAPDEMGTTTLRPPLRSESFAHLAGPGFHPYQCTPMHWSHLGLGARMMPAGLWQRPAFYGPDRERAIGQEAQAVRKAAGLIDVSTLGKIEILGPDAGRFLDAVYMTTHANQPVGRVRYALRCDGGGSVVDDGVVCRLAREHFYLTTTTGQATATHRHMLWLKAQWRMDIEITAVTGAYAALNLAGPASRRILGALATSIDFSAEAFPYMTARMGSLDGVRVRVLRVGFVGELGYEIHMPALYAESLWERLLAAGAQHGIRPFGVEAQRLLRLEKGHAIIGQDTDGLTTPQEAGMGWALPKAPREFWGRAAVEARSKPVPERVLVGFRVAGRSAPVPPECCLVMQAGEIAGRVTSAATSATCSGVIGMAFVPGGSAAPGTPFRIRMPSGGKVRAEVVQMPFYDPRNERQML